MQVDEGGAARGQRPAIRHADSRRLLKTQNVGDVGRVDERVHQRHLGRAGIAEDMRDPLVAQDVEKNVASASGHWGTPAMERGPSILLRARLRRAEPGPP